MKQFNYELANIEGLKDIMLSDEIRSCSDYSTQFIQLYSARNDQEWYKLLSAKIKGVFPSAVIVGASTVGEILEGKILTYSTLLLFSFFESTSLTLLSYECEPGNEEAVGNRILKDSESLPANTKGMLLLSTPVSNDSGKVFNTFTTQTHLNYPIFGGGAGDYVNIKNTLVFDGEQCHRKGVVIVAFAGDHLCIQIATNLGWYPLSKEMTITEIEEVSIKTIDNKPAISIYEKYLGIKGDEHFYQNSLEFPFLIERNKQVIARSPFFFNAKEGSIELAADVKVGEKFRIGYGDPQTIIAESVQLHNKMKCFKPEAIFLFSCICRRFLMQQDVDFETLPFNEIAPTAGFYTFGEFYSNESFNSLLNSSLVVVGFKEGNCNKENDVKHHLQNEVFLHDPDPYMNQHSRILSRLLYFINILTKELEEQNMELTSLIEQKNEFMGIAVHDLRNPLGVILGFSELLGTRVDNELKNYARIINDVSSTMLHQLDDLLDISKIEAGKLDLRKSETDYTEFVLQNIRMNDFLAQNKKIHVESDMGPEHQILMIDHDKIGQVLNNLIGNAIKYSYPYSTITVKVSREEGRIVTQVIDQGQGIPREELEDVFRLYKKTSVKPTNGETSHGLGLAIVKKIVEGHKGEVGVKSEVGKGSIFYFTLPL